MPCPSCTPLFWLHPLRAWLHPPWAWLHPLRAWLHPPGPGCAPSGPGCAPWPWLCPLWPWLCPVRPSVSLSRAGMCACGGHQYCDCALLEPLPLVFIFPKQFP